MITNDHHQKLYFVIHVWSLLQEIMQNSNYLNIASYITKCGKSIEDKGHLTVFAYVSGRLSVNKNTPIYNTKLTDMHVV